MSGSGRSTTTRDWSSSRVKLKRYCGEAKCKRQCCYLRFTKQHRLFLVSFVLESINTLRFDQFLITYVTSKSLYRYSAPLMRGFCEQAPPYITELIRPYSFSRGMKFNSFNLFSVSRACLKTGGNCAFQTVAPKLTNARVCWRSQWKALKRTETLLFN